MNIGDDYKNIQEANKKYLVQDNDVMKNIYQTDKNQDGLHKYGCTVLQHRRENVWGYEKGAFESGKIHIFGVLYYKSHEPYVEWNSWNFKEKS